MKKALLSILPILPLAAIISCDTAKIDKSTVEASQRKVADWMFAHRQETPGGRDVDTNWTIAAWYTGVFSLYEQTKDQRYLEPLMALEGTTGWKLGNKPFFGDDQAIAQIYCDLYRTVEQKPEMIAHFKAVVDEQIAMPDPGLGPHKSELYSKGAWTWCDCLFMAPPAWARLALVTGESKYLDAMNEKYWKTYDYLYDKDEKLFFRDDSFFDMREPNGKKVFWSRGNGWVMAGLARIMDVLPEDYYNRPKYEYLFREMAGRIKELQQPDGLWRASLLDPGSYPGGETSGSGFYTYALAWGVNNGLLDSKTYLPTVARAWKALNKNVNADGKLGWAQPIGGSPKLLKADDSEVYAVGAYLLAGREILKLEL
uniref:Glycosyl hydrolase family 88 n=1 Tax=uncultured bacterium contig00074 TaxID=1181553 RepID=A0A806KG96_9BACT|nr:glycosyl hydrolase family 88 [uncultured bacterium contig00074]